MAYLGNICWISTSRKLKVSREKKGPRRSDKTSCFIVANFLALVEVPIVFELAFMLSLLAYFCLVGEWWRFLSYSVIYGVMVWVAVTLPLDGGSLASLFAIGGRKLLPCFMIGGSVLRTPVHAFIVVMRRCYLPERLILAIAVMMRFFPSLQEDWHSLLEGLRSRGYALSFWEICRHPLSYMERLLVPILLAASRRAQELTLASMTKAAGRKGEKTSYQAYHLHTFDYVSCLWLSLLCFGAILGGGK